MDRSLSFSFQRAVPPSFWAVLLFRGWEEGPCQWGPYPTQTAHSPREPHTPPSGLTIARHSLKDLPDPAWPLVFHQSLDAEEWSSMIGQELLM